MEPTEPSASEIAAGDGTSDAAGAPPSDATRWRLRLLRVVVAGLTTVGALVVYNLAAGTTDGWRGNAGTPPPVDAATRLEIARAFAPRLRFNAWHDGAPDSPQNMNEDHFPMGVASFLREVVSGKPRIVVQRSREAEPAVSEIVPTETSPAFGKHALSGFPMEMVGDPPGEAPTYVHVYEDKDARAIAADGSGEVVVHVEYWHFYAFDRADADVILLGTFGSHRGDWEHTSFRIRVRLEAGGAFASGELLAGHYYSHGGGVAIGADAMERVDDAGDPAPDGRHPVVYVAQGKHASYPQAGFMHGHDPLPLWVADHHDVFHGNGVVVDAWRGRLFDLEDPAAAPDELAPPELAVVNAASTHPVDDWTRFPGRWGPDFFGVKIPLLGRATALSSPIGPNPKPNYGDFGGRGAMPTWESVKAADHFRIDVDEGLVVPAVEPPPAPIRR